MLCALLFASSLRKWPKSLRPRLALASLVAFALASCANTAAVNAPQAQTSALSQDIGSVLRAQGFIAVPLRRVGAGLDTLKLDINGAKGTFLLDTGASNSVIDKRAVSRFNISPLDLRGSEIAIGAGGQVSLASYKITGLTLQNRTFPFRRISATDLSHVINTFAKDTSITLDGIIGQDVMIAYDGVIDTENRTLYLRRP